MNKIIPPGSWDFGEEPTRLIKAAASGLRGDDLAALVKRAGHELADWVKKQSPPKDEVWVHGIAMGAVESSGQNRNADAWKAASLQRDHPTFITYAKAYRNHKSSDPTKNYGLVKRSWFNPEMKRVELIVAYNATKEAALRNGGLVADLEIEKLAAGKDLPWSMATFVDHDVCILCGNKAKTRSEYCDENTCTYMGMKKHAGRVYDDGKVQYVDNPFSRFKDISSVPRGADRTAFVLGKVASADPDRVVSGAELAELWGLYDCELVPVTLAAPLSKLAADLAALDALSTPTGWETAFLSPAYDFGKLADATLTDRERALRLRALADVGVVLPVREWLQLCTGTDGPALDKAAAAAATRLNFAPAQNLNLGDLVRRQALTEAAIPPSVRKWAAAFAPMALDEPTTQTRLYRNAFAGVRVPEPRVKAASDSFNPPADGLAGHYTAYVLNALKVCQGKIAFHLSPQFAVVQNRVR